MILTSKIEHDRFTEIANKCFDVPISDTSSTAIPDLPSLPDEWNIGLIAGPSGCGKTTLLKQFGAIAKPEWNAKAIISNFDGVCTPEDAGGYLCAVGLSSIPAWLRSYEHLSTGERFRADMARVLAQDALAIVDEFTSVVDRTVAKAASFAIQKHVRKKGTRLVAASCHFDVIEWLQPDWIFYPATELIELPRGKLQRPKIELEIMAAKRAAWHLFKQHHYLTAGLPKSCRCFLAFWENVPVAIVAISRFPHAVVKNAWRASRTVVLPDYQGLGIGVQLSNYFGSLIKSGNGKFYSKTAHPAMIAHRLHNPDWRVTAKKHSLRFGNPSGKYARTWTLLDRPCVSFEYVGAAAEPEAARLFWEW